MHKKCFSFQIKYIEKPATFFNNGCKKIVFITKCNEKNMFERHYFLEKKLSASPKNDNPSPLNKKVMVRS